MRAGREGQDHVARWKRCGSIDFAEGGPSLKQKNGRHFCLPSILLFRKLTVGLGHHCSATASDFRIAAFSILLCTNLGLAEGEENADRRQT
jgi:hypothetical protein